MLWGRRNRVGEGTAISFRVAKESSLKTQHLSEDIRKVEVYLCRTQTQRSICTRNLPAGSPCRKEVLSTRKRRKWPGTTGGPSRHNRSSNTQRRGNWGLAGFVFHSQKQEPLQDPCRERRHPDLHYREYLGCNAQTLPQGMEAKYRYTALQKSTQRLTFVPVTHLLPNHTSKNYCTSYFCK